MDKYYSREYRLRKKAEFLRQCELKPMKFIATPVIKLVPKNTSVYQYLPPTFVMFN